MSDAESCSVCGRTILAGERTLAYLTPDGGTKAVCELCRDRAESLGWVWEEIVDQPPATPPRRRRGAGLAAFFRGREAEPPAVADILENGHDPVGREAEPEERAEPEPPPPPRASPDPAAPGAGLGRSAPAPESPATRLERAVARFNASEHARTVAGLIRTLGLPSVSVGAAAGSPSEVRITVAWELSWYQWGVDLKDETRSIYEIDKGHEMQELDSSARQWNATSAEDGRVRLGAPVA
jgi:predicted RNA-binding Zn-ribbon protein involved in translation (DUF1610 family)